MPICKSNDIRLSDYISYVIVHFLMRNQCKLSIKDDLLTCFLAIDYSTSSYVFMAIPF